MSKNSNEAILKYNLPQVFLFYAENNAQFALCIHSLSKYLSKINPTKFFEWFANKNQRTVMRHKYKKGGKPQSRLKVT